MPREDNQSRRRRRRISSGSSINDSSSGSTVGEVNEDVQQMATPPLDTALTDVESSVGSRTDAPQDFTPYNRMSEVQGRATTYEREYRLKLLHRMLMRNVPLDQIAKELKVSVRTVMRDRAELFNKLRAAAQNLNVNELIGDSMGFYKEIAAMGLRAASVSKAPLNMRLSAMKVALSSENDLHRFLNLAGVYDALQFTPGEGKSATDIERLVSLTERLLGDDVENESLTDMDLLNESLAEEEEEIYLL